MFGKLASNSVCNELTSAFVRGFFDGDGSIGFRIPPRYVTPQGQASIVGAPQFIEEMEARIKRLTGLSGCLGWNGRGRTRVLSYNGRTKLTRFRDWLYSDRGPSLSRKRLTFERHLGPAAYAAIAGEVALKVKVDRD